MSSDPSGTSRKMITSSVVLAEEQRELLIDVAAARTAKTGRRFSMSDVIRELVEAARTNFETETTEYYRRRAGKGSQDTAPAEPKKTRSKKSTPQ